VCLEADCDYSFGLLVCLVQQTHRLESRARIRRSAWLWERDSPATDRSIYLRPGICLSLTVNCPTNAPIDRPGCRRDPEPYSFRFFQRLQVSFRPTPSLLPLAEHLETAPPPPKIEDPFPSLWKTAMGSFCSTLLSVRTLSRIGIEDSQVFIPGPSLCCPDGPPETTGSRSRPRFNRPR
jgi:hypothetical protein